MPRIVKTADLLMSLSCRFVRRAVWNQPCSPRGDHPPLGPRPREVKNHSPTLQQQSDEGERVTGRGRFPHCHRFHRHQPDRPHNEEHANTRRDRQEDAAASARSAGSSRRATGPSRTKPTMPPRQLHDSIRIEHPVSECSDPVAGDDHWRPQLIRDGVEFTTASAATTYTPPTTLAANRRLARRAFRGLFGVRKCVSYQAVAMAILKQQFRSVARRAEGTDLDAIRVGRPRLGNRVRPGGRRVVDFGRSRSGGNRTPNRRFWKPVLYQLSYAPMARSRAPQPAGVSRQTETDAEERCLIARRIRLF